MIDNMTWDDVLDVGYLCAESLFDNSDQHYEYDSIFNLVVDEYKRRYAL